jgi:hypothetical protein
MSPRILATPALQIPFSFHSGSLISPPFLEIILLILSLILVEIEEQVDIGIVFPYEKRLL